VQLDNFILSDESGLPEHSLLALFHVLLDLLLQVHLRANQVLGGEEAGQLGELLLGDVWVQRAVDHLQLVAPIPWFHKERICVEVGVCEEEEATLREVLVEVVQHPHAVSEAQARVRHQDHLRVRLPLLQRVLQVLLLVPEYDESLLGDQLVEGEGVL